MDCKSCRTALSVRLDDETSDVPADELAVHMAGCMGCRSWLAAAERLQRTLYVAPAERVPDLTGRILAAHARTANDLHSAADIDGGPRRMTALRWALAAVAMVQITLGLVEITGQPHHNYEVASWTVATAVGFLYVAVWPRRIVGVFPVIATGTAAMLVIAVRDPSNGLAALQHEPPHLVLLAGTLLLAIVRHTVRTRRSGSMNTATAERHARRGVRDVLLRRTGVRRVLAVTVLSLAWLLGTLLAAAPAHAHADLLSSNPAAGARLPVSPGQAVLVFTEEVALVDGGIRLLDSDGRERALDEPRREGVRVVVPLPDGLDDSGYVLTWRVASTDSHPVSGSIPFAVGNAAPPAAGTVVEADGGIGLAQTLLGIVRWAGFAGVVLLVGVLAFTIVCWPAGAGDGPLRRLALYGAVTVGGTAWLALVLQGVNTSGRSLISMFAPELLGQTIRSTFGQAAAFRLALAAIVIVLLIRTRGPLHGVPLVVAASAAGGMLVTLALSGHAIAADGPVLAVASDTLHLAAMACWLGGLVVLITRLLPGDETQLRDVLPRWSQWAMNCVGVLVLTGTYQAWREIGTMAALTGTAYGRLLMLKVGIVLAMLWLGSLGRSWVQRYARAPVPQPVGAMPADTGARSVGRLRRSVLAEVGIGALVLALTSVLVATTPGRTDQLVQDGPETASLYLPDGIRVDMTVTPPTTGQTTVRLQTFGPQGGVLKPQEVKATASLPERNLARQPLFLHGDAPGIFSSHGSFLPFPGRWLITVTVRTSEIDAGVATTSVTIRPR